MGILLPDREVIIESDNIVRGNCIASSRNLLFKVYMFAYFRLRLKICIRNSLFVLAHLPIVKDDACNKLPERDCFHAASDFSTCQLRHMDALNKYQ